ncbi:hypothetical protein AAVH_39530, partial [Aphelenchoides avenae]
MADGSYHVDKCDSTFHICDNGTGWIASCSSPLVFDVYYDACREKADVTQCNDDDETSNASSSQSNWCQEHGFDDGNVHASGACSPVYFLCLRNFRTWQFECPEEDGTFFSEADQTCRPGQELADCQLLGIT